MRQFTYVILAAFLIALLAAPSFALTYSKVDRRALPLLNVYDPETRENEDITQYSFEELDAMFDSPRFRTWNDLNRVCQSMDIMFGRVSSHCAGYAPMRLPSRAARAYVDFTILPPPMPVYSEPRLIIVTDPLTPPWPPAFQRYRYDDPYW